LIHRVGEADDPRIAAYARVGDHRSLLASGLFVAEGRFLVQRLIDAGRYHIVSVLLTPAALDAFGPRLELLDADVYVAQPAVLNAVTGFNFHRGCLALARRVPPLALDRFYDARRLLILERVGNPDNVGGLFRVAAALGSDGILLDPGSADPFYRKAIRTSMGAVLHVPFARIDAWPDELRTFSDRGVRLLALSPHAAARELREAAADVSGDPRIGLLLGAEGAGLTAEASAVAHERVRIPMDAGVDSLNVVVAAAIALYALA
jgi:tRNA G18 (ribose-2'-O)-methylase SpoU